MFYEPSGPARGLSAKPRPGSALVVPQGSAVAGLGNNVKSVRHDERQERRHSAYRHKNTAANILLKQGDKLAKLAKRVSHCRYVSYSEFVTLEADQGRAGFDGLKRCNSVWCCPLCSVRISSGRRDELNALLSAARAESLSVVMLTLTASHKRGMKLAEWLQAFKGAKQRLRRHRHWSAFKPIFVGSVTATEVTHSDANGFHPHFHELLILDLPPAQAVAAVETLRGAWLASLAGVGLSGKRSAFQVQPASAAGEYVAKFGAAEELALQGSKQGRGGSRSPWQLLSDISASDDPRLARRSAAIWAEYAAAFQGRRQLVWSPGLKARFGIADKDDAEIAEPDQAPDPVVLRAWFGKSDAWRAARRRSCALLDAAETGGNLDAAEFGPTDAQRWALRPDEQLLEPDGVSAWQAFAVRAGTEKQATTPPSGVVIPDNGKGAENPPIDGVASFGDYASDPAMARAGYDLPRNLSAVCVSRAAFAHGKDKSDG